MMDCEEIAKSEDVSPQTRERARSVFLKMQFQHLARENPGGARAWVEAHTPAR
jgi:hypothetical protein